MTDLPVHERPPLCRVSCPSDLILSPRAPSGEVINPYLDPACHRIFSSESGEPTRDNLLSAIVPILDSLTLPARLSRSGSFPRVLSYFFFWWISHCPWEVVRCRMMHD